MMKRALAACLAVILIVPLFAPQFASAQVPTVLLSDTSPTSLKQLGESAFTAIKSALSEVSNATTAAASLAQQVNTYVLQPLAFVLSGNLMKALTSSVIAFVIGKANGTGIPQFETDVRKSIQTVADGQALAFLDQLGRNSNSPFTSSFGSALRNDYLSKTSLQGFWRQNMDMLARTSPNPPAYLQGRWQHGGIAAWFVLTTQQTNPYTAFPRAKTALASVVGPGSGGATGARKQELDWGTGFLSWCSPNEGAQPNPDAGTYTQADADLVYQTCLDNGGDMATQCDPARQRMEELIGSPKPTQTGVNPGDPCQNADGTPGKIKTPGTTIKAQLDKVLGGQQDQIVRMGNIGPQINSILQDIGTVMQTVQFASQLLGGPGSGGLFGVDATTASRPTSRLIQYQSTPGNLGVTNTSVTQATGSAAGADITMENRISAYMAAWNSIGSAANTAVTSLQTFANTCTASSSAAQTAVSSFVNPILAQVASASSTAAITTAMIQRVRSEVGTPAYNADINTLQSMQPTSQDLIAAQREAVSSGAAVANPPDSLNVSGGTMLDRMNLLNTNAQGLSASCP